MKKHILILLALAFVLLFASCDGNVYDLTVTVNWTVPSEIEALLPTDNIGNCYFELYFGDSKPKRIYYNEPHTCVFTNVSHIDRSVGIILYDDASHRIAASSFVTPVFDSDITVDLDVAIKAYKLSINFGFNDANGKAVTGYLMLFPGDSFTFSQTYDFMAETLKEKNPDKKKVYDGWFDGAGNKLDDLFVMPDGDLTITARWH